MFPGSGGHSDASSGGSQNHQKYRRELERIRGEMAGFKPIDHTSKPSGNGYKTSDKPASARMSVRRSRNSNNTGDYFADEGEYY